MVKNLTAMKDPSSILGLGRSPEEGNGNPLQCSCLGNHMDRGAWWATVHGVTNDMTERLTLSIIVILISQYYLLIMLIFPSSNSPLRADLRT